MSTLVCPGGSGILSDQHECRVYGKSLINGLHSGTGCSLRRPSGDRYGYGGYSIAACTFLCIIIASGNCRGSSVSADVYLLFSVFYGKSLAGIADSGVFCPLRLPSQSG